MKPTNKRYLNLKLSSLTEYDLNKSSIGCGPCLRSALKIEKKVSNRTLNEIKIEEIKKIVRSIFESSKRVNQEI